MAEQLRAKARGLEGAAEPDHQREEVKPNARLRPVATTHGLDSKGCEADEAPAARLRRGDERAVPQEPEEVLPARLEPTSPGLEQLTAHPELARDLS